MRINGAALSARARLLLWRRSAARQRPPPGRTRVRHCPVAAVATAIDARNNRLARRFDATVALQVVAAMAFGIAVDNSDGAAETRSGLDAQYEATKD